MQYMLLLYANEASGQQLSEKEMAAWMKKMGEYGAALEKAGAFVSTGGLGLTKDARVVHIENGKLQVHNGPYADTQEQLGGYYLIDVPSREDAENWAARCPAATWGHVEIREIMHG